MSYSPQFSNTLATGQATSSRKIARNYTNGSGSTLSRGTPVSTLTSGLVTSLNVSIQDSMDKFVGIYDQDTPNAASGRVIDSGLLENFTTSFAIGDPVYVGKTGNLTNIVPSIGVGGFVSGDFVIFIGIIVQNEFNNLQKDLKILIEKVGSL